MPAVSLGFQQALDVRDADHLSLINCRLAEILNVSAPPAGLLDYRPLRSRSAPEHFCAYWLWADWSYRDRLFADPPEGLRNFLTDARPLWAHDPDVGRYTWSDDQPPDSACEPGDLVRLAPGGGSGRLLVEHGGDRCFGWSVQAGTRPVDHETDLWLAL